VITLKFLEANNFKCLHSVILAFPERGTLLIEGHNEAGKSTLFEAVYVALYGKPLVGEEDTPKRDEVIQHGQSQATVQLIFDIGQQELTVERVFERGKSQQAILTIRRPGAQPEVINRVRAVDDRILKELGNLDGSSLRNSCFVEQKELGRIEALKFADREQAIRKLLGLERLTQLIEQFKFRREQRDELNLAEHFLRLAQLQAEVRATSTAEAELAERLDAVEVVIQTRCLAELSVRRAEIEKRLKECSHRIQQARERLNWCSTLKEYLSRCDQIGHRITDASHAHSELDRVARELIKLDAVEKEELPQARAYLKDVTTAANMIVQSVQARKRVQEIGEAVREAQRSFDELEQAESEVQRKEEELSQAQGRVGHRRNEAEADQQHITQRLDELNAKRVHLEQALALVEQWESAYEHLQAIQREISAAELKQQELVRLQVQMQQNESAVHDSEADLARARQEMQQADYAARMATAQEALGAWVRLKGVEKALNGYTVQRSELLVRHQEAEDALAAARTKTRAPLFAGIALSVLTILILAFSFQWFLALIPLILFLAASIAAWIWFFRARQLLQQRAKLVAQGSIEIQRLDMQRQAAIEAGGDPTTTTRYEQQIQAAGLTVPANLEAGRSLQQELQQRLGDMQRQYTLQEVAQHARENHIRIQEQLKQAQNAFEQSRQNWYLPQQSGNPMDQIASIEKQAAEQERAVSTVEQRAAAFVAEIGQWPTTSNTLQTQLVACQAELRSAMESQKQRLVSSERLIQDTEADKVKAENALKQAQEKVVALKASNPVGQLFQAKNYLIEAQKLYDQQERVTHPLLQKLNMQTESEVAPEKGRAEAIVQALEKQLAARRSLEEEFTSRKANYLNSLVVLSTMIGELQEDAKQLTIPGLPILLETSDSISSPDERASSTRLSQIRQSISSTLNSLDEQRTRTILDGALGEQGKILHEQNIVLSDMETSQQAIDAVITSRGITNQIGYTIDSIVSYWPIVASVSPEGESNIQEKLNSARNQLYAARQQEQQLSRELQHPGTPLSIEECQQKVDSLIEEREVCALATSLLNETHDRIARLVLPITERNMQPLLQQLTGGRYRDVRLTPEEINDQPGEMDYRIRVWDTAAGRYVAKNLFSGGTRDQCSLALRLAFALATLPQELGVAPGFIFLDEPLSAFDAQRAHALVELITTGTIAQQFSQVALISHQHAFEREAFQYHVRMESGQVVESDLPLLVERVAEPIQFEPVSAGSE
jgi:DNA repair exonuclease SbcCD ATPase subunit